MLAMTSGQVGFFDAAELARPLPEGSFFALLAEHGDRIVRDEDFAACYSERIGRPSIPPSQLAKVLLLQYRSGASDEQAMECVAWDLRWKIALGLAIDHQGWHPTSLTKFRARLLLHGKDRVALERTLELARELGMLDGPVEQIIDSTPMLGAAATQDTVRLVRHGVRKLLGAVASADEQAAGELERALEFDYARPGDKPMAAGASRSSASGCSRASPRTPSGRCGPWSTPKGCWMTRRWPRRIDCCATWSARTSTSTTTASRGCIAAPDRGGSSRRSTPSCVTAARARRRALTATSCRRRRPTPPSR